LHFGQLDGRTCRARPDLLQPVRKVIAVKNLLIAAKVFAFVNLLFVPSIALIVFVAFLGAETWWFAFIGVPALFGNLIFLLIKPVRELVWMKLGMISGQPATR
jgi:uncharacterized membrane protein YecN with MAPEG domain